MKKALILFLVVAFVIGLLGGCGGGDSKSTDTNSTASTPATDAIFSTEKVSYVDLDGDAVYRIVRPDGNSDMTTIASSVFKRIKSDMGISVKSVADSDDGTDKYEILIGNTNRPESQQALQYLRDNGQGRYNDYIICTIGKKIVINGMTLEAITAASEYFIANYLKSEGIEGGLKYTYATPGDFETVTINGNNVSKYTFIRDLTNRSWLIQNEVDKIQASIKSKTGFILELKEDKTTTESEYEIIIGNTTRPGVTPQSEYHTDEYEIKISGKKVYIMGGSTYAVQVGVTEFAKMLEKGAVTEADSKTGSYSQTISTYDSGSYYRYVWGDEFEGTTLDSTKWVIADATNPGSQGPVNLIKNDYTCRVEGGNLIMSAFKNDAGGYDQCDAIKSTVSARFNMGYLEMRARIPDAKGVYSSFWLLGGDKEDVNKGGELLEIDIFESLGNAGRQMATIHKWRNQANGGHTVCDSTTNRDYRLTEGSLFDEYRTIGLLWNETDVVFYYDGVEYYHHVVTDNYFANKFVDIIAGFNVGWKDRTKPDENIEWPLEYHVDYIRLYQIDGQSLILK